MDIQIERPVSQQLEQFFKFLKSRAEHKDHEANRDLIADFVDKVLVFEIKRVANTDEAVTEDIEIPEDVLVEPLLRAKQSMDDAFSQILKSKGIDLGYTSTVLGTQSVQPQSEPEPQSSGTQRPRSGNGHSSDRKRALENDERDTMRQEFLNLNGQLADNDKECTRIHQELNKNLNGRKPLSVWQVTGFISVCHRYVAQGSLQVRDMNAYIQWMKEKYPGGLYRQYNDPKNQAKRQAATQAQSGAQTQGPKFAGGFPPVGQGRKRK